MDVYGYRNLTVWERAMELTQEVYAITRDLPADERFGLTTQMRRAAVSVPSNIAEGRGRTHAGDYLKHLSYARGSLAELETQIELCIRVGFLERDQIKTAWSLTQETGKMLTALIKTTKQK